MQLTAEQVNIINSNGNIKINAVAGSGKTTTIIEYAASLRKQARILYIAFNKSVRLEAKKRFSEKGLHNVKVETAHSLAYKKIVAGSGYAVHPNGYKTYEIAQILNLTSGAEKHAEYILANHINKFVAYFCNSNKQKVSDLNYLDIVFDAQAKTFVTNFYPQILNGARQILAKMDKADMPITHDFYLKKFQLQNPVLPYDYILFDEAQDASPAMLDVFLKQKATKIIVGDSHQQIYSWRLAVNSMDKVDFTGFDLSTSFRFNQPIADLAISILNWKNHLAEIKPVSIIGKGNFIKGKGKATIARTNLGLLVRAITFTEEHPEVDKLYFEGNINSYTYADDGASLYDVLNLYNNEHERIRDHLLKSMKDLEELEDYIEKTEDVQLAMMLDIVNDYGNEIPSIIRSLKEKHVDDENRHNAEMIFSTVHRSKGMEYGTVQLVEDFITESKIERIKNEHKEDDEINIAKWNEEINLLYVAVTRTKGLLLIPATLIPRKFPSASNIQIIKQKKDHFLGKAIGPGGSVNPVPVSNNNDEGKTYTYLEQRLVHKNAYKPWSTEADIELKEMYYKGIKLHLIAQYFGRNEGATLSRLKKIGCVNFEE